MEHPISLWLQELSDELSPPMLSERNGRFDGSGVLSKGPLKFNLVHKDSRTEFLNQSLTRSGGEQEVKFLQYQLYIAPFFCAQC